MFFQRVILRAANELGIPYVVVSHGFVTDPKLVTIAPLYADMFVAWTEDQRRGLCEAIGPKSAVKVHHFGFPKPPLLQGSGISGRVLLVWHPFIESHGISIREFDTATTIIKRLATAGLDPVLRLHPKDRSDAALANALKDEGVVTDHSSISVALGRAEVVLGSLSSLLIEAASVGKPVFQLSNYPSIPDLPRIDGNDDGLAETIRLACGTTPQHYPSFDSQEFFDGLLHLMKEKLPLSE